MARRTGSPPPDEDDIDYWDDDVADLYHDPLVHLIDDWPATDASDPVRVRPATGAVDGQASVASTIRGGISARALMSKSFPPIRYVIVGILTEGCTLFAGAPKTGKSWMALAIAIAVATGGLALGSAKTTVGDVLYLALEDNERRLASRLEQLGAPETELARLTFLIEAPDLAHGLLERIDEWRRAVGEPRLVVVDIYGKIALAKRGKDQSYDVDYRSMSMLQKYASEHGIALLVVHHTRKQEASDDPFDLVSGTRGLTGAADAVLVLDRRANSRTAKLYGRGRDISEFDLNLVFDDVTGDWTIEDAGLRQCKSPERRKILTALQSANGPLGPAAIAQATGLPAASVRHLVRKLLAEGHVQQNAFGEYLYLHTDHSIHGLP